MTERKDLSSLWQQQKYYSFIIATTNNKQIAEKWSYYILSVHGELYINNNEPKVNSTHESHYEFNICIDAFNCSVGPTIFDKFILAQGDWLKSCLSENQNKLLKNYSIINYQSLPLSKLIKFRYYFAEANFINDNEVRANSQVDNNEDSESQMYFNSLSNKFIEIKPSFLLSKDCLIFSASELMGSPTQLKNGQRIANYLYFKSLIRSQIKGMKDQLQKKVRERRYCTFKSEYALLSDQHFLNCLVRGKKGTGSYEIEGNFYQFTMDEDIYLSLLQLNLKPRL